MTDYNITYSGMSHEGMVRSNNEDYYHIEQEFKEDNSGQKKLVTLLIVADGMGGARAGELASSVAVNSVVNDFANLTAFNSDKEILDFLTNCFEVAHNQIANLAMKDSDIAGMGTTMTIALLIDNVAHLMWVGDSRAYVFNTNGKKKNKYTKQTGLRLMTKDHSMIWSQIENGHLSLDEAESVDNSHIITQSLGSFQHKPNPDYTFKALKNGDVMLLCTDGINRHLDSGQLSSYCAKVQEQPSTMKEVAQEMKMNVLSEGAEDNFTLIFASFEDQKLQGTVPYQDVKKSLWNSRRELIYGGILALALIFGFNHYFGLTSTNVDASGSSLERNDLSIKSEDAKAIQLKKDSLHKNLMTTFDAMFDTVEHQYNSMVSYDATHDSIQMLVASHATFLDEKIDRRSLMANQDEVGIRIFQDTETQFQKLQTSYFYWMKNRSLDENK